MMTLTDFAREVMLLIRRAQDAGLQNDEIADALQCELDEIDDGPKAMSDPLPDLPAAGGQ